MGRAHFATGAVTALGTAAVLDLPVSAVPVLTVVGAASAYMPGVDHPNATAAKCVPPFSWGARWAVRLLSVRTVGIAHRGLTHTIAVSLVWAFCPRTGSSRSPRCVPPRSGRSATSLAYWGTYRRGRRCRERVSAAPRPGARPASSSKA